MSARCLFWARERNLERLEPRCSSVSFPTKPFCRSPKTASCIPKRTIYFAGPPGRRLGIMADLEASRINHDNHLLLVRRPTSSSAEDRTGATNRRLLTIRRTNRVCVSHTSCCARTSAPPTSPSRRSRPSSRTCSRIPPTARSTAGRRPKMSSRTWIRCWSSCGG